MSSYKVSRPYGFHEAFENCHFDPTIANIVICLALKFDYPNTFKEFGPISTCSKILHHMNKLNLQNGDIAFKVDLKKAYNNID
ncbi:hypothetical protein Lal_00029766 [Lupinus albus]|nr:hypothetical protein Lal_00029766 [Lupinus albus]